MVRIHGDHLEQFLGQKFAQIWPIFALEAFSDIETPKIWFRTLKSFRPTTLFGPRITYFIFHSLNSFIWQFIFSFYLNCATVKRSQWHLEKEDSTYPPLKTSFLFLSNNAGFAFVCCFSPPDLLLVRLPPCSDQESVFVWERKNLGCCWKYDDDGLKMKKRCSTAWNWKWWRRTWCFKRHTLCHTRIQ